MNALIASKQTTRFGMTMPKTCVSIAYCYQWAIMSPRGL